MKFETQIRVRYGETDQMGFVYYGNYALYFEQARTEMLRNVGFTYKQMEESGVLLPVVQMNIRYKRSAKYDDLITVKSYLKEKPLRKIVFFHEIYNENGKLLNNCEITLVFMNHDGKVISCPTNISEALSEHIFID